MVLFLAHTPNEWNGWKEQEKGYIRIHRNHKWVYRAGQPNWMTPVSSPFVNAPFVVLEFIIPNKWAAWGGGWGEVLWKWKSSKDFQRDTMSSEDLSLKLWKTTKRVPSQLEVTWLRQVRFRVYTFKKRKFPNLFVTKVVAYNIKTCLLKN